MYARCYLQLAQNPLAQKYNARGAEAWTRRLLGEIALRRDAPEIEPAEGHYRNALNLASESGMRPLMAHCHRGLGTLYRQIEQHDRARCELSAASALYREMAMTFYLQRAEDGLAACR